MRTFHVGGVASRSAAADSIEVKSSGVLRLHNIKTVQHASGNLIAVSSSGELTVADSLGRGRERYKVPYGATLTVQDNMPIQAGKTVATWDPHTRPVITEVAGILRFVEFVEGVSVKRETDDMTGLSSLVVLDPKQRPAAGKDLRPKVKLVGENGEDLNIAGSNRPAHYVLTAKTVVSLADGAQLGVGDVIARALGYQPQLIHPNWTPQLNCH
ncbi:hypothetical protein TI04_13415 [Achromatium sp. WMS2]|nr:hypothetical protein TI04_13415 [Achromatium sp. WMS2]